MMKENRLWVLMSRRLSGEASPADVEELQQLLEHSPDKQYLLDILHSYFTAYTVADAAGEGPPGDDQEQRFLKLIKRSGTDGQTHGKKSRIIHLPPRRIAVLAAVVIPLLGIMIFLFRPTTRRTLTPKAAEQGRTGEVLSRAGVRTKLVLPDGTKVWLNSSSKLRYAQFTESATREVELEGEAFFDVAKDPQRPFIVHADSLEIKVLGTAFTIKSYPQDPTIETTLLQGAIEITRKDNPNTPRVILKPNEKLVFNKHLLPVTTHSADSLIHHSRPALADMAVNSIPVNIPDSEKVETGWMYNKLVFNGDSFKELSEKMERWYNVRFIFKDTHLYNYHFGGSFTHETVQEALDALQLTANFTYKINGNEIELYEK
ncbi:MAG: FecR family protein [Chitinophagaceae bacterium]|nr:FecR family protein [Chitinophagaceae bacterium]